MKKLTFYILLLSINSLCAQFDYEWEYSNEEKRGIGSLTEAKDGNLFAASYPLENKNYFLKFNSFGTVIKQIANDNDSLVVEYHKIIWMPLMDKYLVVGGGTSNLGEPNKMYYLVYGYLDEELNFTNYTVSKVDVNGPLFNFNYLVTDDNEVLVVANAYKDFGPQSNDVFVKFSKMGNVLNLNIGEGLPCYSIIANEDGFKCMGLIPKNFDNDFNLVSTDQVNFLVGTTNQSKVIKWRNNTLLIGARPREDYVPSTVNYSGLFLFNTDLNIKLIKAAWIAAPVELLPPSNVFDIASDSSIYTVGFEGLVTGLKSFSIAKFDKELKKVWHLTYDTQFAYRNRIWGMEVTNDDGVILYGHRLNWPGSRSFAYMIKFNAEGNIVFTHNVDKDDLVTFKTYPNPSTGILHIEVNRLSGMGELRIFDAAGRNVYVANDVREGKNTYDLTTLPQGNYTYCIYNSGKQLTTGQWLKVD